MAAKEKEGEEIAPWRRKKKEGAFSYKYLIRKGPLTFINTIMLEEGHKKMNIYKFRILFWIHEGI